MRPLNRPAGASISSESAGCCLSGIRRTQQHRRQISGGILRRQLTTCLGETALPMTRFTPVVDCRSSEAVTTLIWNPGGTGGLGRTS